MSGELKAQITLHGFRYHWQVTSINQCASN